MSHPRWDVEKAPPQHPSGEHCSKRMGGCNALLSIYNPYRVCGPCRRRIERLELPQVWRRVPYRLMVRRGPLGMDEFDAGMRPGGVYADQRPVDVPANLLPVTPR